jgi:hypothetical protein
LIFARSAIARVLRRGAALTLLSVVCSSFLRRLLAEVSRACCGLWQRCAAVSRVPRPVAALGLLAVVCSAFAGDFRAKFASGRF